MDSEELKKRTKTFGLRIIKLYEEISKTKRGEIIGNHWVFNPKFEIRNPKYEISFSI